MCCIDRAANPQDNEGWFIKYWTALRETNLGEVPYVDEFCEVSRSDETELVLQNLQDGNRVS